MDKTFFNKRSANNFILFSTMPQFSNKEVKILLIIGVSVIALGLIMAAIGAHFLAREIGVPEYLVSLRNSGVTVTCLALLWTSLAAFRKTQLS